MARARTNLNRSTFARNRFTLRCTPGRTIQTLRRRRDIPLLALIDDAAVGLAALELGPELGSNDPRDVSGPPERIAPGTKSGAVAVIVQNTPTAAKLESWSVSYEGSAAAPQADLPPMRLSAEGQTQSGQERQTERAYHVSVHELSRFPPGRARVRYSRFYRSVSLSSIRRLRASASSSVPWSSG